MSSVFLVANILGIFWCFFVGHLSDRIGNHKLLTLLNLVMAAIVATMMFLVSGGIEHLGVGFDVCLVLISLYAGNFMLSYSMIMKLVGPHTRGSMLAFAAIWGVFGVVII